MRKEKIKRTYLKFVTDKDGSVNIKFGPQRYAGEMEEFFKLLMMGNIQSIKFLSSITKEADARENLFHRVGDTYNAILLDAFPDIEEKILAEDSLIAKAVEATEEGIELLNPEEEKEFQNKKKEIKESLVQDFEERIPVNAKTEKELIDQLNFKYGVDYEELLNLEELVEKTLEGKYLNKKDRSLLAKLSYLGLYYLDQEFVFLDLVKNQKVKPDYVTE